MADCALPRCEEPAAAGSSFCPVHRAKTQPRNIPAGRTSTNSRLVCPHCQTSGHVTAARVKAKRGVSGGKATGAVLTGGLSLLATGLSRKETVTRMSCGNCHTTWTV